MSIGRLLPVLVALGALACSSDQPRSDSSAVASGDVAAAPLSAGSADSIDLAKYKLTMANVEKTLMAGRNLAIKMKGMSEAERDAIDLGDGEESIEQMAAKMKKSPHLVAALKEAGLSAEEYATITMAMLQAGMGSAVADMQPKANLDSLAREMNTNPDNIKWIRENKAELERKQKAMEAELKKLGVS